MRMRFMRFPEGKAKAVTMSYDDGVRQDIRFSDIITEHGFKCTFNHNSATFKNLTEEEVRKIVLERGHELAVHGAHHCSTGYLRPIDGIREMLECRLTLEKTYGIIIRGCAYPDAGITRFVNGTDYAAVKNYLTELDIAYARSLGADNNSFGLPADFHNWIPTAHHANPHMDEYIDEFLSIDLSADVYYANRAPRLFYIWGHTYEFDFNDNWDLLENICEKLGGKDDVWYATNMEIYNYVQAYNSLIYSADGHTVFNPTIYTVWFDGDGRLYSVKPGETLKIAE